MPRRIDLHVQCVHVSVVTEVTAAVTATDPKQCLWGEPRRETWALPSV